MNRQEPPLSEFRLLACDYDRTLAEDGVISSSTRTALLELKQRNWLLGLVTGREFEDLKSVCTCLDIFDIGVIENGALLYKPSEDDIKYLGEPPPSEFLRALQRRSIPFTSGNVIVAANYQWAEEVEALINELELDLTPILNRDSVMILPSGVDKTSGIKRAAAEIEVDLSQVIGVGDAENDVEYLRACGLGVAVANAIEPVKAVAGLVMTKPAGQGVAELIHDYLLAPGRLDEALAEGSRK